MKDNKQNHVQANDKPFENQQQLRNHVVDKFVKHGSKVKYQVKLTVK